MPLGFDYSVSESSEDYLRRWPFAHEIYQIATNSPEGCPVRIGVYGKWGSGKTSVLNFISGIATENHHVVIRFNPWNFSNIHDMWREFVLSIYRNLEDRGFDCRTDKVYKESKAFTIENFEILYNLLKLNKRSEALVEPGFSIIQRFLEYNKDELAAIIAGMDEKKVFVLIDDLDRTEPRLVVELLYTIKELFNIPGFVFVMALDPDTVGHALKNATADRGGHLRFLENVIDFPRWIPAPSEEDTWALIKADRARYCSFIHDGVFMDIFKLLPERPQTLRMFLRQLSFLNHHIRRYYHEEIHWTILLLCQLLKLSNPQLVNRIFSLEKIMAILTSIRCNERDESDLLEILRKTGEGIVGVDEKEKQLFADVLLQIGKHIPYNMTEEVLLNHVFFIEAPPILTQKEYDSFYGVWEMDETYPAMKRWIEEFSTERNIPYQKVYKTIFAKTVEFRHRILEHQLQHGMDEPGEEFADRSFAVLKLLSILSFELEGFRGRTLLEAGDFQIVFDHVLHWIHLRENGAQESLREAERAYIQRVIETSELKPEQLMGAIKPWEKESPIVGLREREELIGQLAKILEPRVLKNLISQFRNKNLVSKITNPQNPTFQYLFFRADSPLWKGANREMIQEVIAESATSITVQYNLIDLLQLLPSVSAHLSGVIGDVGGRLIVDDEEIVEILWQGALVQPFNWRFMGNFNKIRLELGKKLGRDLAMPCWWKMYWAEYNGSAEKDG